MWNKILHINIYSGNLYRNVSTIRIPTVITQLTFYEDSNFLSYLSVTTRAVIGQFSGPYSTVQPTKIDAAFVDKRFCDLTQSVLDLSFL